MAKTHLTTSSKIKKTLTYLILKTMVSQNKKYFNWSKLLLFNIFLLPQKIPCLPGYTPTNTNTNTLSLRRDVSKLISKRDWSHLWFQIPLILLICSDIRSIETIHINLNIPAWQSKIRGGRFSNTEQIQPLMQDLKQLM